MRFAGFNVRPGPGYETEDNVVIGQVAVAARRPSTRQDLQTLVGEAIPGAPVDEEGNEY